MTRRAGSTLASESTASPMTSRVPRPVLPILCLALLAPAPAWAWGFEAHRFIADRAIALLPDELQPFFEAHRAAFVERSLDPDTWRIAGFEDVESPRHFFDIDRPEFGAYPYAGVLRDQEAAVRRWGRAFVDETGTVPWRAEEMFDELRQAFAGYRRRGAFGRFDIVFFAAWLTHYVSDAHVPFHAVVNYDGQLTGQRGIHARFESALFERYRERLAIEPVQRAPVRGPRDAVFEMLVEGAPLAGDVLAADRRARDAGSGYGDAYYERLFAESGAILTRRVEESIAAVAAMIAGAWNEAGRPPVPVGRSPQ